jgi:hypothetical protein
VIYFIDNEIYTKNERPDPNGEIMFIKTYEKDFVMTKLMSTPYLVLLVVLGGITITTALAATTVTITYPYTITDGTNQRLVITSAGNVGIGISNPSALLSIKQAADTSLGGISIQNHLTTGSMRYWEDTSNNGHIAGGGGVDRIIISTTGVYFPSENVGIGTAIPTQPLDVAGNVHLTGNMTVTPTNEFKITTTNSKDICIGSC